MKKSIALLVAFMFALTIIGAVVAQADDRSPAEKLESGRAYLKTLDTKIVKYRKLGNNKMVSNLKAQKTSTLARLKAWKAEMEASVSTPVAPVPPPVTVKPVAAPSAGLFGWGLNTILSGQWINTGKGQLSGTVGLKGDVVLDDFIGAGPMVGLSADTIKYKLGLGVYDGGGAGLKGIPVYAGGIINLPAEMLGGVESYLTGGLNYVVYGNGKTSGKIGGDAYFGMNFDLGLGLGKTGFELGYSVVRTNTASTKGFSISVSQPIAL